MQMGDHGVSGQHKYQLEEAQRAEKRVRLFFSFVSFGTTMLVAC